MLATSMRWKPCRGRGWAQACREKKGSAAMMRALNTGHADAEEAAQARLTDPVAEKIIGQEVHMIVDVTQRVTLQDTGAAPWLVFEWVF